MVDQSDVRSEAELELPELEYANELKNRLATQNNMLALLEAKKALLDDTAFELERQAVIESKSGPTHGESTSMAVNGFLQETLLQKEQKLKILEKRIERIRIDGEIIVLKKVIAEKENYYERYLEQFKKDYADMQLHYKTTLALALKSRNENMQKLMATVVMERVEEDVEKKIAFYKQMRKYM